MATPQRELDHQYRMQRLAAIQSIIRMVLVVCCFGIVGATVYLVFRQLAGRQTFADIAFKVAASLEANKPVAIIVSCVVTALTGAWGASERFLRKRYIKTNSPLIDRYQKQLNPNKISSHLTEGGDTQKGDK